MAYVSRHTDQSNFQRLQGMTGQNIEHHPLAPTFFANIAIACFAYAVLSLLSLHVLRPDYSQSTT